jgi:hypothetical protein
LKSESEKSDPSHSSTEGKGIVKKSYEKPEFRFERGEKSEPVSLGGYKITLSAGMGFGTPAPKPDSEAELGAGVSLASRAMPSDKRPFAIVVNTAPDEFLFIGANGDPAFAIDSGPGKVFVSSKDQGRYENGDWIPGRRINGDEVFESSLPKTKVGMLKVKLVHIP